MGVSSDSKPFDSSLLHPLVEGEPVSILVSDPRAKLKRRIGKPILFIAPAKLYGYEDDAYIFSLQGQGCEVLSKDEFKITHFIRMGLSGLAAKLLVKELNLVFNLEEKRDGIQKTKQWQTG